MIPVNGKFRNLYTMVLTTSILVFLAAPLVIQKVPDVVVTSTDTLRNILMLMVGFYFGSSDYDRDIHTNIRKAPNPSEGS
jgi:hypothetical protein